MLLPLSLSSIPGSFTMHTAKMMAAMLVMISIIYNLMADNDPCRGLLTEGRHHRDEWESKGCMMHNYTQKDVHSCLKNDKLNNGSDYHIVFFGDSRVRQVFQYIESLIKDDTNYGHDHYNERVQLRLYYESKDLHLKLEYLRMCKLEYDNIIPTLRSWESGEQRAPDLILLGWAVHYIIIHADSEEAMNMYEKDMLAITSVLESIAKKENGRTRIFWKQQAQVNHAKMYNERIVLTPESIDRYNAIAARVLGNSTSIRMWSSFMKMVEKYIPQFDDGMHFTIPKPLVEARKIFLNLLCNDIVNFSDGSCCNYSSPPMTTLQAVFFSFLFGCSILAIIMCLHHNWWVQKSSKDISTILLPNSNSINEVIDPTKDWMKFFVSFSKLGIIIGYAYTCDRTSLFSKDYKDFSFMKFYLPIVIMAVVGILGIRESKYGKFLNRDQSDEWKGWMQLVILVYHFTGASQVLPIYMFVRFLVTSYIFLNGYGNFFYNWLKGDYSIYRFLQVLFRMNFLTIVLCLAMNQAYQFYYFVPLISFWFCIQFALLAIPPKVNQKSIEVHSLNKVYMVAKIVLVLTCITIVHMSQTTFERFFMADPLKPFFSFNHDNISEWWFRWSLDRNSMLCGLTFGFLTAIAQQSQLLNRETNGIILIGSLKMLTTLGCLSGITAYVILLYSCQSKIECNYWHENLSFIPVVCFILLRNMFGFLQKRFSFIFAWFGRISLELFIVQYHIWLAADTHGILILIPDWPMTNAFVATFVFVCIAHEVHAITETLTPFFIPRENEAVRRNLWIFLVIFVLTGIYTHLILP